METNLVLDTAGLHLVGQNLSTVLFGLGLVDILHQHTLVLEDITLGFLVERVVTMSQHRWSRGSEKPPRKA